MGLHKFIPSANRSGGQAPPSVIALPMRYLLCFLLVFVLAGSAYADKVDDLIRDEMKKRDIPGLALMLVREGKPAKTGTYGLANLEWKTPVSGDTVFEIGSVTKQFTAAGIMLLVQDGKLDLEDKISVHLPNTPPAWAQITVKQLLNHTSGIKSYTGLDGFELTRRLTQAQFIKEIGTHPLEFAPGDAYKYSNSGYSLLGYIIENASGKSYWDFLGERIFTPLKMTSVTNREPSLVIPKRASGYEKNKKGARINRDYDLTDIFAAGAIVSTIEDMAKWDAALYGEKILSVASKEQMWTPTRLNNGTLKLYGLGWSVEPHNGHKNIGHSGSTSGFSASFQRFPDHKLTVIVLCNSGESGVATKLAKAVAELLLPAKVAVGGQ